VYTCTITLFWFTDYVTDPKIKYELGWYYLYFLLGFISLSLVFIISSIFVSIYVAVKKRKDRKNQVKVLEAKKLRKKKEQENRISIAKEKRKRTKRIFLQGDLTKEREEIEEIRKRHQKIS